MIKPALAVCGQQLGQSYCLNEVVSMRLILYLLITAGSCVCIS